MCVTVNGTVILILVPMWFLLTYWNTKYFCSFILYSLTLVNSFLCTFLKIFYGDTMSSAKRYRFHSFFPICVPLFSCHTELFRISRSKFIENIESRNLCLAATLRDNTFSPLPLSPSSLDILLPIWFLWIF